MNVYTVTGQERKKAVLVNHSDKKEMICRKLGVVCEADIDRIAKNLGLGKKP
jgi:hypothetical protein